MFFDVGDFEVDLIMNSKLSLLNAKFLHYEIVQWQNRNRSNSGTVSMRKAGRHFLQIPGPSAVPDRVLRAISSQTIDHRGLILPKWECVRWKV